MNDLVKLTSEEQKRRKSRSIALAVSLAVMVILFYLVTLVKFAGGGA